MVSLAETRLITSPEIVMFDCQTCSLSVMLQMSGRTYQLAQESISPRESRLLMISVPDLALNFSPFCVVDGTHELTFD